MCRRCHDHGYIRVRGGGMDACPSCAREAEAAYHDHHPIIGASGRGASCAADAGGAVTPSESVTGGAVEDVRTSPFASGPSVCAGGPAFSREVG